MRSRRGLREGEFVVLDVRPHWWRLAPPVSVLAAVIAGAIAAVVERTPAAVHWLVLAALIAAVLWLVGRYLRWAGTRLLVTDLRVAERTGVLSRRGREIPLTAIADLRYRQSFWGRMIGEGDLLVESAGRNSAEVFRYLPHPMAVHGEILGQMQAARMQGPGSNIPQQIDQLDQLRRRGVISDSEFATKKTELLNRL